MPLNAVNDNPLCFINIPIKKTFTYLDIEIYLNLHSIVRSNHVNTFKKIEADLLRWSNSIIPFSLYAGASVIKMDILHHSPIIYN